MSAGRGKGRAQARRTPAIDFQVSNHGSVFLLHALTSVATAFVDDHVNHDDVQWWAGAIVVEHRYIRDIVDGAQRAGLVVA